jgi:glycosyltransferase involved in cell wall biosynthesis
VLGCAGEVVDRIASRRPGTPSVVLPSPPRAGRLRAATAHLQALRRLRPHVLHASLPVPWSGGLGVFAGLATRGTAVVAVEQLPIKTASARKRAWKRALSRRLGAHVAVGEASARQAEAYAGLPTGSIRTIWNGVPDPGPAPRVPHAGIVLAAVGRLDRQKGFDVLLEALVDLTDVRLLLIGAGGERETLAAQARRLRVERRVTMTGWSDDVPGWLAQADIFVLPSRSEAFPLAILEAMLAGLPVVATDVGSVAEEVRDGETGLLVGKDDPEALANALRKLIEDPDLRAAMGRRGRQVAGWFTVGRMVDKYLAVWQGLIERHA